METDVLGGGGDDTRALDSKEAKTDIANLRPMVNEVQHKIITITISTSCPYQTDHAISLAKPDRAAQSDVHFLCANYCTTVLRLKCT